MKSQSAHFLPGVNKRLGQKYLLLENLGDGTHGWVWRAERLSDGEIVAVKVPKELSREDRSLAEGQELKGIDGHPNVIKIFDMGRVPPEKEWYAIEMEYFPSESLAQKLEHRSHHFGNTYQRLFNIYGQVLDAVDFLASLDPPVSHGDIKPHNILVGQSDLVKLTDFGSSALPEEIYLRTRENGGTVLYAAPEFSDCVSRKGSFQELLAGDIYSLGVLLYQLMTGRLPHDTQAQVRRHATFAKPREINASISPMLEQVILTCLRRAPAERYSSIGALKSAFRESSRHQLDFILSVELPAAPGQTTDWSTEVISAMEVGHYDRAARIAASEHARSGDMNAVALQLHALFRHRRWSDFTKAFESTPEIALVPGNEGQTMRLQAIKVFMKLRALDKANRLLDIAREQGEMSLEHRLCEASIAGIRADYPAARSGLEDLNRAYPRNPEILSRLIQVCEQQRDYHSSAGFLRAAVRLNPQDEALAQKRRRYELLGAW